MKASSWSGLADYAATVKDCYRKDYWEHLPEYVHIFCEKDAVAATLEPVSRQYDVALSVCRGYVSVSLAGQVARLWRQIEKPIHAYYFGDHDPSGLDMENNLRDKLAQYSGRSFEWTRLGILPADAAEFDLLPLSLKKGDTRTKKFRALGYDAAYELDALPSPVMRRRLEAAILSHIPQDEWERLQRIEDLETEQWHQITSQLVH